MGLRTEIEALLNAINGEPAPIKLQMRDEEFVLLEGVLALHPEAWPIGLSDTLRLLRQKLNWEPVDLDLIPEFLKAFFEAKFKRDLDPMALARNIGGDIHGTCAECECKC